MYQISNMRWTAREPKSISGLFSARNVSKISIFLGLTCPKMAPEVPFKKALMNFWKNLSQICNKSQVLVPWKVFPDILPERPRKRIGIWFDMVKIHCSHIFYISLFLDYVLDIPAKFLYIYKLHFFQNFRSIRLQNPWSQTIIDF